MKGEICKVKKYRITVNGQTYEVEVEEVNKQVPTSTHINQNIPTQSSIGPSTKTPEPQPKLQQEFISTGSTIGEQKITAPMPGIIMSIEVKAGDNVQKGDTLMILEAMKMENEIITPKDGVIVSIDTSEGASVDTGDILATIE